MDGGSGGRTPSLLSMMSYDYHSDRLANQAHAIRGLRAIELPEMSMYWSDQVYAIHDVPPGTPVSVENGIQYYAPEGSRRAGVRHAGAFGHGWTRPGWKGRS